MVCSCKTVIYNKFFIFQAPTPEDNNLVTSSEDKIPKVTMLNASSQTITKVSVCEKGGYLWHSWNSAYQTLSSWILWYVYVILKCFHDIVVNDEKIFFLYVRHLKGIDR